MNLDLVMTQLKTYAPMFGGRVAGAANFAVGLETQVWMDLPAAYVIPLDEDASENLDVAGLRQTITERIGIIVELDNAADRRGQAPAATLNDARAAVFAAVLGWHIAPDRSARGLYYGGGQLREFDRARLFYQFEFCLDATYTYADGFQQPPGVPLVMFQKTYTDAETGHVFVVQNVEPPTT